MPSPGPSLSPAAMGTAHLRGAEPPSGKQQLPNSQHAPLSPQRENKPTAQLRTGTAWHPALLCCRAGAVPGMDRQTAPVGRTNADTTQPAPAELGAAQGQALHFPQQLRKQESRRGGEAG